MGIENRSSLIRWAGLYGMLAPIIALSCIGISIALSPWFSWTENWLSDLGGYPGGEPVWSSQGASSVIFNLGLVVAGILGMVFAIGVMASGMMTTGSGRMGARFLLLDSVALIGVGVFPLTIIALHEIFAVTFFLLALVSFLLIGIGFLRASQKRMGWFTIGLLAFGMISIPLFMMDRPWGNNAIAEIIPVISVSVFLIVFGLKLFRKDQVDELPMDKDEKTDV
jgi:hypothetical membrane protein